MHHDVTITSRKDKIEAVKYVTNSRDVSGRRDRGVGKKRTLGHRRGCYSSLSSGAAVTK